MTTDQLERTSSLAALLAFHARPEHAPAFALASARRRVFWTSVRRLRVDLRLAENGGQWL